MGGGGARGRNELTGRDPPTRHCGSTGKAGREKEGGRDRDVGLQPAREATARGAVAACGGAGPALLGNLRRLLASCPREAGSDRGSSGISGTGLGLSWSLRAAGVPASAEGAGSVSFLGGAVAWSRRGLRDPRAREWLLPVGLVVECCILSLPA